MLISIITIAIIDLVFILVWLAGTLWIRKDQAIELDVSSIKRLLVIFPHPDDETLSAAGLLATLTRRGISVSVRCMTHGEMGLKYGESRDVRVKELSCAMRLLQVTDWQIEDYGDGQLESKESDLKTYVHDQITNLQPSHVLTFDTSGLYGHPDHIVLSRVVTGIVTQTPNITLMYASLPRALMQLIKLPIHMATDPTFASRRMRPTHRLWIGPHIITKIRSIYAHKSQIDGFRQSKPRYLPLWYLWSMVTDEYFAIVTIQPR